MRKHYKFCKRFSIFVECFIGDCNICNISSVSALFLPPSLSKNRKFPKMTVKSYLKIYGGSSLG